MFWSLILTKNLGPKPMISASSFTSVFDMGFEFTLNRENNRSEDEKVRYDVERIIALKKDDSNNYNNKAMSLILAPHLSAEAMLVKCSH